MQDRVCLSAGQHTLSRDKKSSDFRHILKTPASGWEKALTGPAQMGIGKSSSFSLDLAYGIMYEIRLIN